MCRYFIFSFSRNDQSLTVVNSQAQMLDSSMIAPVEMLHRHMPGTRRNTVGGGFRLAGFRDTTPDFGIRHSETVQGWPMNRHRTLPEKEWV